MQFYPETELVQKVNSLIKNHIKELKSPRLVSQPVVSVLLLTYNHKNYIRQAIESVINQKTNFDYEIVIGDDFSTDGTREIILEYYQQYPEKIRLLLADRNLWQPLPEIPMGLMGPALLETCRKGKYTALLDGDDYWLDQNKLQKQVDFLETNPNFVMCFHNVLKSFEDTDQPLQYYHPTGLRTVWTIEDLCRLNFIPTCSVIYRNNLFQFPDWFLSSSPPDWLLHFLHARHGKIKYLDEVMGVFRIHSQSSWTGAALKNPVPSWKLTVKMLENVNQYFNFEYDEILSKTINDFKKSVDIFDSVNTYSVSLIVYWRELSYLQLWAENIQYFQNTEIIFIHQITDETNQKTLANFADQYNISLIQIEKSNSPNYVKNYGLKIAKGEYIFFSNSNISINRLPLKYIIELTNNGISGLESISSDLSISYIKSNAMCAKKSVLENLGGWDEQFNDRDWADLDLCYRAKLAGYSLFAIPEMAQWLLPVS